MSAEAWVGVAAIVVTVLGGLLAWMFTVTKLLGSLPSISKQLTRVCRSLDDNTDQHAVIWKHLDEHRQRIDGCEERIGNLES